MRTTSHSRTDRLLAAVLTSFVTVATAQVPGIIAYQGHLSAGGTNVSGTGHFKFALVSPGNPLTTYWSNDGTSIGGSTPTASIQAPLTDGIFTVLLGDTAANGSIPIPPSVFIHSDVRLRIWVSTNAADFNLLAPDQRLGASAYALQAAATPDDSITPAMLAPDAVTSAKIAPGAVATTDIANGAVTEPKLAAGAVTQSKLGNAAVGFIQLGDEAVRSQKIAPGAVTTEKLSLGAVTAERLANGSVTAVKIANGAVGSAQLSDAVTLRALNLGSVNWDGSISLYAQPVGGGGIVNPGGLLRGQVFADDLGMALNFHDNLGRLTLELSTMGGTPRLELSQPGGSALGFIGANGGAGYLRLNQTDGKVGVVMDGDKATPDNNSTAGGEIAVYQRSGIVGLLLDGDHEAAGRIEVRQANGTPFVDIIGKGANNGGELRVKDNDGTTTAELLGQAGASQSGQLRLFSDSGRTNVILKAQAGSSQGASLTLGSVTGSPMAVLDAQATDTTGAELHLYRANGVRTVELDAQWDSNGESKASVLRLLGRAGTPRVTLEAENSVNAGRISLRNQSSVQTVEMVGAGSDSGGQLYLSRSNGDKGIELDAQAGNGGGWIGLYKPGENTPSITLNTSAAGGARITTQVLEITGGSDLSERFNISSSAASIETIAGMVLCIDPEHPGNLVPCTRACDTTVAGVISGAGGVQTGMMMGQPGTLASGQHPVALSGRVYCWVDASRSPIKPGDLLTTSNTPGHAMKAPPGSAATGAILGKAMTPLARGRGLVLVLVSLQ